MDLDPEARRRAREEKKQRKEERAQKRAAKEARRQQRERLTINGKDGAEKAGMMGPPAGASQFAVSESPEKEGGHLEPLSANGNQSQTPVESLSDPKASSSSSAGTQKNGHRNSLDESSITFGPPGHLMSQVSNARGDFSPTPTPRPGSSAPPSTRVPTPPTASSSKRPRPSENAEAGPSTSKTPKTPKRRTATTKRTPAKSTPARAKEEDPWPFSRSSNGDDDVRARLSNESSKNEFLAAKFWPIAYLNRLEQQGSEPHSPEAWLDRS